MDVSVNHLAVFLAAFSTMVVGGIWYAKGVFGSTWAKLARVDMNRRPKRGEMVWLMSTTFVASLVTAYVLALFAFLANQFFQNSFFQDTFMTALWLWFGFTAARFYTHDAFEGRRKKLTILNLSYELLTVLVMALIIGMMGY